MSTVKLNLNPKISGETRIYKVLSVRPVSSCISKFVLVAQEMLTPDELVAEWNPTEGDERIQEVWVQHSVSLDAINDLPVLDEKLKTGQFELIHGDTVRLCEEYLHESVS